MSIAYINESRRRELCAEHITLNDQPAVVSGVQSLFATVCTLDGHMRVQYAWSTVDYIITQKEGKFKA